MNKGFEKVENEKITRELGHFTQEKLLGHRFRLVKEGKDVRDAIRELFTEQHRLYPEFIGVGFLGSQIKGYAKPDSDWDLNLLFDEGKKQYSDISDSLTPVNRAFEEFSDKKNIVFGKDYSYPEVKFSVYDGARLSRDMSDLSKNLTDKRDDDLRTIILDGYVRLFLPYIGI
jgi:hypothetical protein